MPEPDVRSVSADVTVIGCGLMGAALARQLAKSGYRVAAWNRTPERAEALATDGVKPIRSVVDAVRASPLVVACMIDYTSTLSALDPVESWDGATLVNVANGTPEEAEECERWAAERGAHYLDGGIFAYPQDIGSPEAALYYSGPTDVWSTHERTLMALAGASRHVSEEIKTANVMFVGISAFFMPAMSAYVEAATYLLDQGVSVEALREITVPPLQTIAYVTDEAIAAISGGRYETDQATVETYAETTQICLAAVQGAGYKARLLAAALENMNETNAAGLGKLGYYSQTKVARVG
jgi:3-hydroxyisobutyrate dehydrogenase-like beta-hydroxyacid dehydrogenase